MFRTLISLLATFAVCACAPKGSSPNLPATLNPNGGPKNGSPNGSPTSGSPDGAGGKGTSDGAGGNGVGGEIYEAWHVDPELLPSFKSELAPRLERIKPASSVGDRSNEDRLDLLQRFGLKTWYIAPVKLKTLSKDSLGLPFIETGTEQFARQSNREIFIDQEKFDKMDSVAQAKLLLHEFVETIYLAKFEKFSDLCNKQAISKNPGNLSGCLKNSDLLDLLHPPQPARALDKEDNENIRQMTSWLWDRTADPVSEDDIRQALLVYKFDQRIFETSRAASSGAIPLPPANFLEAIRHSQVPLDTCADMTGKLKSACEISISERIQEFPGINMSGFDLTLSASGHGKVEMHGMMDSTGVVLNGQTDTDGAQIYMVALPDFVTDVKAGDRIGSAVMFFKMREGSDGKMQLALHSVLYQPGIITKTIDSQQTCQARPLEGASLLEKTTFIYNQTSGLSAVEKNMSHIGAQCYKLILPKIVPPHS